MRSTSNRFSGGFTLIEIAVVIVILGLVSGAIILGRDLIFTAGNRALMNEIEFYRQAVHTFRMKYSQLPGDMTNPEQYWPTVTWTATGNGDKWIIWKAEGPVAWKQLYLAGFTKFDPSLSCFTMCHATPGENIPPSPNSAKGGWTIGNNINFPRRPRNVFILGAADGYSIATNPAITGITAQNIDTKLDDGIPNAGDITARSPGGVTACFSGDAYNLNHEIRCSIDVAIGL